MKDYFNLRKSKLLLFTLLTMLVVGASPARAQKALPYSYGFEEASCSTSGWTKVNCHSSSENNSASAHSGSYAFRFYYTSNYPQYLISPELATSSYSISVSFWYKAHSTSYEESFQVGYSTTDTETSSFTFGDEVKTKSTNWQEYSTPCPAGTKYICIACTSNDKYCLYIDDLVIDSDSPYKTPKAFASTGVTATTATFGWTAGSDETAWQIAYSSTEGFDADAATKVDVTTNPYTLEGLTAETTYYARIRADYGSGNYSAWSSEVSFKPTNAITTTVNDGSTTNSHVPFNGKYADTNGTMSQFIIPASTLTSLQGRMIQDMTFYTSTATNNFGNARFDVYMAETSVTTFDAATFNWSDMDQVAASATVNIADGKMTITLDEGFNYSGDNLKIGFKLVATGGYKDTPWYGIEVENAAIKNYVGYSGGATIESFLPKITFTSMPGVPVAVKKPKNLAASKVGAATATLGWTDGEEGLSAWEIAYSDNADFAPDTEGTKVAANANPFTLTELTAATTYYAYVRAKKGDDYSKWSNKVSFTTTERYPAPAGLAISNLTTTSATLTWTAGEATAWEVAVNTTGETPTEAGAVVNAATYEFTELTEETTYYAFVRTKDGNNYSAWSAACEFLPSANTYLTVNDGTTTNSYVPVYGYFSESTNLGGQFIIPAASLTDVQNKVIKKLTFYSATSEYAYGDAEFDVCLKEVSDTYFPSSSMYAWDAEDWTKVYSGTIAIVGGKMNITFTSDYSYNGSNLLVGIHKTSTDKSGSNYNVTFYGNNASSNMSNYSPNGNRQKFQPKTTIGYQEKTGSELKVFDGETELAVSPASFDFGLAEAGATHTFTLKNTAATPYVATISSESLTVDPTSVTPTAEGVTFTVTMPAQTITDEAVVITPAAESGLEPFTINVSGTVKDPNKLFEDFSGNAKPEDWTATGNSYNWSFTSGYASYGGYSASSAGNLTTPKLTFTAGEKFFFDAKMSSTYNATAAGMTIQTSTDGNSFSDLMTITSGEISSSAWNSFSVEIPSADVKYIRFANCIYMAIDNVYGGSIPVEPRMVVTQPTSLDFGAITENTAKTFTIANTGKATLNGITVTSSNNDVFTISGAPTSLEAGASQDVTITMAATTTGVLSSEITVSATDMEDVKFTVTGVVVPAGLPKEEFTGNLPENWTNSGWSFADGIASAKSTSTMTTPKLVFAEGSLLTIKIKNYDTDATNKITIKGSTDNGSTWTYTKEFPSSNFISNSDWTTLICDIPSNVNKLQFVGFYCHVDEIAGLYYAPELAVKQGEETVTSPVAYNFGENLTADATVTYTLSNAGAGTLNITNVAITGEGATAYSTNWTESVAAPFDLTITRTYDGARTGVQEAVVTVTTNDGDFVVNVTGSDRGYDAPEMSIDATPIDFGKVSANDSKTITVTNIGTGSMTVNITSDNALFTINPAQLTEIGANQSKDFTVTFNYNNVEGNYGEKTANITVTPTYDETANVIIAATAKAKNPNVWSEEFADANIEERGWTKGGWSITDGKAVGNSGAGYIYTPYLEVADASEELTVDYEITSSFGAAITYQVSTDRGATWSAAKYYPADYGKTNEPLPNGDKGTFTISVDAAGVYQFRFQAMGYNLDNFEGFKRYVPEHDAKITDTNIPTNGYVGRSYTATVTVAEKLGKEGENATATLYFGDEAMASETKDLTAGGNTEFTLTFTPEDAQSATAKIVVSYAGGELNGTSKSVTIHEVITFDEANGNAVESGQLVPVLLKRSFIQGWNTICVPFAILNPKSVFGDDVKIYQFTSYSAEQGLGFTAINLSNGMDAGVPYLAYIPSAVSSELFFESVSVNTSEPIVTKGSDKTVTFQGTYNPINAGGLTGNYVLTTEAKIAKASSNASMNAFRAYFTAPAGARMTINFDNSTTGIGAITTDGELEVGAMYNLQGQKVQGAQKGLYIINGKKVVRK